VGYINSYIYLKFKFAILKKSILLSINDVLHIIRVKALYVMFL